MTYVINMETSYLSYTLNGQGNFPLLLTFSGDALFEHLKPSSVLSSGVY